MNGLTHCITERDEREPTIRFQHRLPFAGYRCDADTLPCSESNTYMLKGGPDQCGKNA